MDMTTGHQMYNWITELFPLNRSLTGNGVRTTLKYIKSKLPDLRIFEVPSGTKAFDWVIPKEWEIKDAWIKDLNGNKLIDFKENNLHVVGYSIPINKIVTRSELELHLHSIPGQPNAIPYITSYYEQNFGFCLSQNQRNALGDGPYHIYIDSKLFDGNMTYAELFLPGESDQEVLFTTYICHPSMANNELSGPAVAIALAQHIQSLKSRKYSYRFIFNIETIGSIYYISKHLQKLQEKTICGWVLTCLGDDRTYSYLPTKDGNTYTDKISRRVLQDLGEEYIEYSWLDRGSDERQYNAPGIDLPIGSLMRSKYKTYPEYHTSLDNLEFISPEGLQGGLNLLLNVFRILETNSFWKIKVLGEPHLSRRQLYPALSTKTSGQTVRDQMNVISYLDGTFDLLSIANKCNLSYNEVLKIIEVLDSRELVCVR